MDNYQAKQLEITRKIEDSFKNNQQLSTIVEPVSDYVGDNRICLTSVAFLPSHLEKRIIDYISDPLKQLDSSQCFYVPSSFHITIQNIRTIGNPLLFTDRDIEKVRKIFARVIPKYPSFQFEIRRLFELPTSLAISAFSNNTLGDLALELRKDLKKEGLPDNKTYINDDVVIGNITISRFTKIPNDAFREKIKELKEIEIGSFEIKKISLITTNAVCHPSKTKIIEEYFLNK